MAKKKSSSRKQSPSQRAMHAELCKSGKARSGHCGGKKSKKGKKKPKPKPKKPKPKPKKKPTTRPAKKRAPTNNTKKT
jgi:hypothetical protein